MKALFIDRDGVINDNKKHVNKPEDLKIYSGVGDALKSASEAGFSLFVVTNQGGIEMGHMTEDELGQIHKRMVEELKPYCEFKEIAYCPDFNRKSECRKPNPGMILKLADKYDIELEKSYMIGDMDTDVEAGIRAGCKTAKIGKISYEADVNGATLPEVIEQILKM